MKKYIKMFILTIGILGTMKYLLLSLTWLWTEILFPLLALTIYYWPITLCILAGIFCKDSKKSRFSLSDLLLLSWISKRK